MVLLLLYLLLTKEGTNELPWLHCWQPKLERAFPCSIISDNAAMFERKRLRMIKLALGLLISDNAADDELSGNAADDGKGTCLAAMPLMMARARA